MRYASLFKKLVLQTVRDTVQELKIQVDELRSTVTTKSETAKNAKKKSQCENECKEPQLNKLN